MRFSPTAGSPASWGLIRGTAKLQELLVAVTAVTLADNFMAGLMLAEKMGAMFFTATTVTCSMVCSVLLDRLRLGLSAPKGGRSGWQRPAVSIGERNQVGPATRPANRPHRTHGREERRRMP